MNIQILAAMIQIGAMAWLGAASLDILRKQTLAKNMHWVLEHPEFLRRHHRPEYRLLIALTVVGLAFLLWSNLTQSFPTAHVKNGVILVVALILSAFHGLQEKRIGMLIPAPERRSATLKPRTTCAYVPKILQRTADASLALLALGFVSTFAVGLISADFLLACAVSFLILATTLGWGRWAVLTENSPHFQQVRMISDKDLSENYRRFSLQLFLILQTYFVILLTAMLVFQLNGFQLVQNPLQDLLRPWLGGEVLPVLLRYDHYDVFVSLTLVPLLLYIPMNSAFRDIRSIDLLRLLPPGDGKART